jgi:hypothetical protein
MTQEVKGRMSLNWSPEVISDFTVSTVSLLGLLFLFRRYSPPDLRVVLYIKLMWLGIFLFGFLEGIGILYSVTIFGQFSGIAAYFSAIMLVMAVNYALNETYGTYILVSLLSIGPLLCYAAMQPDAVVLTYIGEYPSVVWRGLYQTLSYVVLFFEILYFFVWAVKIRQNAPFEIRNARNIFFLGAFIMCILSFILNILFFWISWYLFPANIAVVIGLIIISIMIKKEPKLLFVLPFTPYRVLVMNRQGVVLHQYVWSQAEFKDPALTQFLGALQYAPSQSDSSRGVLEVRFREGVLILHESALIRVGLFVSKASKLLRELLQKFSDQFETKFQKPLSETKTDPAEYEAAHELIAQYFSIFPSRLIDEEKKPLFLSKKVYKIPLTLETKLREIVKDEKAFESIKCEIQRSFEKGLPSEFLELYEELKDQIEESEEEDSK